MVNQTDLSSRLAIDARDLNQLKIGAQNNRPEALKTVAQQFESVLMNMMLKSMREAGGESDNPFDSEQSRMYTGMLDQQLTQKLGSKGIGLADALYKQMLRSSAPITPADDIPVNTSVPGAVSQYLQQAEPVDAPISASGKVVDFKNKMLTHAEEASQQTGIPAEFMIGQAALESGWGKHEIRGAGGEASHNLFGIKASGNWKGKTVDAVTTEYVAGVPHRRIEKFRAYDNYGDAFKDYAKTLSDHPRYSQVIASAKDIHAFAHGLQRAGYATDPQYAAKLVKVIRQTMSV